jgi:hypothetical protein
MRLHGPRAGTSLGVLRHAVLMGGRGNKKRRIDLA